MALHEFLRTTRHARGLTAAQVAQSVGLNPTTYLLLETAATHRLPKPEIIEKLSDALEVEPGELVRAAGYDFGFKRQYSMSIRTR